MEGDGSGRSGGACERLRGWGRGVVGDATSYGTAATLGQEEGGKR